MPRQQDIEPYFDGDSGDETLSDEEYAERSARLEELAREYEEAERDPHYYDFVPGYATEMDYMNALEADDYRNEGAYDDE